VVNNADGSSSDVPSHVALAAFDCAKWGLRIYDSLARLADAEPAAAAADEPTAVAEAPEEEPEHLVLPDKGDVTQLVGLLDAEEGDESDVVVLVLEQRDNLRPAFVPKERAVLTN
jgi:hypothetical protein